MPISRLLAAFAAGIELRGDDERQAWDIYFDDIKIGRTYLPNPPEGYRGKPPFIDGIKLEPAFQNKGYASQIYAAVEQKIGRQLLPSPLGLSPQATRMWQKRLQHLSPRQIKATLDEAYKIGRMYGLRPQSIIDRFKPLSATWQPPEE